MKISQNARLKMKNTPLSGNLKTIFAIAGISIIFKKSWLAD
jgi:hypothetical protein